MNYHWSILNAIGEYNNFKIYIKLLRTVSGSAGMQSSGKAPG